MDRVEHRQALLAEPLSEGVEIDYHQRAALDGLISELGPDAWLADEGAMDVGFQPLVKRGEDSPRLRGLAFDRATTLTWDEDEVQVLRRVESGRGETGCLLLASTVLLRQGFRDELDTEGCAKSDLYRIDVLRNGVHLGSGYTLERPELNGPRPEKPAEESDGA